MSRLTRAIRFARHWHARAGVLAALFFLFLAFTGLALNHTDAFKLDRKKVDAGWLMQWYGLKSEAPTHGYLFESGYFIGDGERWVMDGRELSGVAGTVLGAVEIAGIRYIATAASLRLYQADGSLIDKLTGSALPALPIHKLGRRDETLVLDTAQGIYSSADGLTWESASSEGVVWAHPQVLPAKAAIDSAEYFAPSLPLERVLLDVHSGRILGRFGPFAMDLVALVLMALALSGIWIYLRSIRKRH